MTKLVGDTRAEHELFDSKAQLAPMSFYLHSTQT